MHSIKEKVDDISWYKIYRQLCTELEIIFPLKQSEICTRINPIPNNLEFHKKNISKKELNNNLDEISKTYYKIYKTIGEELFEKLNDENLIFQNRANEYPDRKVNISTVISSLYLSGYKGELLYQKSLKYLLKGDQKI